MSDSPYHIPALLQDAIDGLNINPSGIYVDVTFGGGGHSRAILSSLAETGKLYGFDRDIDALANVPDDSRFTFVHSNYRYLSNFLRFYEVEKVDGILADLGVSFHHFDDENRGFSFRADAPLDMRMNREDGVTAYDIVNGWSEEELEEIFRRYTDLKRVKGFVQGIVSRREMSPIATTFQLCEAVSKMVNPRTAKKDYAQVFQAIRIAVNGEMESLERFLAETVKVLKPGGRLAVITYHSIEDRIVKNFMKTGNVQGVEEKDFFGRVNTPWKLITRSPITPDEREVEQNPRSRSAKLRVAELKSY